MGVRPQVVDRSIPKQDWIEKNIDKMMVDVLMSARKQRQLPLSITFHGIALQKFIQILKSKSAFFPNPDGTVNFLEIPIHINNKLPYGTFVLERFKSMALLK